VVLDVIIDKESLTITVADPFHPDLDGIITKIGTFVSSNGMSAAGLDLGSLIPKMIKGIAGCENGCPSNAKGLVSKGVKGFELEYIEGGILSARSVIGDGKFLYLKLFPDF
jgi:hypothetical protein